MMPFLDIIEEEIEEVDKHGVPRGFLSEIGNRECDRPIRSPQSQFN